MRVLLFLALGIAWGQTYDLPNNDADCPANCRKIPWLAGADTWNGSGTPGSGTIPVRAGVPCTSGVIEGTGTTDNTAAIESCLAAISNNQASVLPAGTFYVNGVLNIPANKSLRGAGASNCAQGGYLSPAFRGDSGVGAACTTIRLGTSGKIAMYSGSGASRGSTYNLSSGFTKGSESVVSSVAPADIATNDYVVISQLNDSSIPATALGENGNCDWCGEDPTITGTRTMTQVVQVTNKSGNTLTLSRPLYYTFQAGLTPRVRDLEGTIEKVGLENLKVDGYVYRTTRTDEMVSLDGCMKCWVSGTEIYMAPATSSAYHIYVRYSYGGEIRDNYLHGGVDNSSGTNYSPGFFQPNSDFKVENNIIRENRHALACEGGCSGMVFAYNYVDDQYDATDLSYLGSGRINHGAHPYMNLLEGNIISHYAADSIWGSSSHNVFFRNWLWGDSTGNYAGWSNAGAGTPNYGFVAVDISDLQHYYSLVGNVLGRSDNLHANWDNATVTNSACGTDPTRAAPVVYYLGCLSAYSTPGGGRDAATLSTMIRHGNYDYKTAGVAHWDGGANHALANSVYYASKPAWMGAYSWPMFGPEPTLTALPAMDRYNGIEPPVATGTTHRGSFRGTVR